MTHPLATLYLSRAEIDALAVAVARGVCPPNHVIDPATAGEAARIIWAHHDQAGQPLCSLATMFAEAVDGLD